MDDIVEFLHPRDIEYCTKKHLIKTDISLLVELVMQCCSILLI